MAKAVRRDHTSAQWEGKTALEGTSVSLCSNTLLTLD